MAFSLNLGNDPRGPGFAAIDNARKQIIDETTARISQAQSLINIQKSVEDLKTKKRANKLGNKYDEQIIQTNIAAKKASIEGTKATTERTKTLTKAAQFDQASNQADSLSTAEGFEAWRTANPEVAKAYGVASGSYNDHVDQINAIQKSLFNTRDFKQRQALMEQQRVNQVARDEKLFDQAMAQIDAKAANRMAEIQAQLGSKEDIANKNLRFANQWNLYARAGDAVTRAFIIANGGLPDSVDPTGELGSSAKALLETLTTAAMLKAKGHSTSKGPSITQRQAASTDAAANINNMLISKYGLDTTKLVQEGDLDNLRKDYPGLDLLINDAKTTAATLEIPGILAANMTWQKFYYMPNTLDEPAAGGKFYMLKPGIDHDKIQSAYDQLKAKGGEDYARKTIQLLLHKYSQN